VTRAIDVAPDHAEASRRAAERFSRFAIEAIDSRGVFRAALAGGETPRSMYELAAADARLDWTGIELFQTDERWVPPGDARSNARMLLDALLDRVRIPAARVHFVDLALEDAEKAARAYELELDRALGSVGFDLVVLGVGEDGHTASLFASDSALDERARRVAVARAPKTPHERVTLTLRALDSARVALFLATGAAKSNAVARALASADAGIPAARVEPREQCLWFLDSAAARGLR
jgi:6-phosphogluconolactonase